MINRRNMRPGRAYLSSLVVLVAVIMCRCGGRFADVPDGSTHDGATACAAEGISVCGGSSACACPQNIGCFDFDNSSAIGFCGGYEPALTGSQVVFGAHDGYVSIEAPGNQGIFLEAEFVAGELVANNGEAYRVHYADFSDWTGEALPENTPCVALSSNVALCGGTCGACANGTTCIGRSPSHPLGICLPSDAAPCGDCTAACFSFLVAPDAQQQADAHGICFAQQICAELAAKLPGGARCAP